MTGPVQKSRVLCSKCLAPTTKLSSQEKFSRCETHGDLTVWEVLGG